MVNVPVQMDTDDNGQEDDGNDQDRNPGNKSRDFKRAKNGEVTKGKAVFSKDSASGDQVVQGQILSSAQEGSVSHSILLSMVDKILDLATDKLLLECVDGVLTEEEDGVVSEVGQSGEEVNKVALEAEWSFPNDFVMQGLPGTEASP